MKRIVHLAVLILTILSAFGASQPARAASSSGPAILSLSDLGAGTEVVLHGPYDTAHVQFSLPATWTLQEGSELDLVISAYFATSDVNLPAPTAGNSFLGALLDVSFNGKLQQSVPLNAGNHLVYKVPIEVPALKSANRDGSLDIGFFLNAAIDCNYSFHHTTVVIDGTSQAVFPYAETALHYDLHQLPWPLYQNGLKTPDPAMVVVPARPTASELQSGFVAMGALGRMSHSKLPVTLITTDDLTDSVRGQSNLVFVGKAASFPMLGNVPLPAPLNGSRYSVSEMQPDDGIVQLGSSPWNPSKTLLVVGGNSDAGVVKAAEALSTGALQTGLTPDYSVIADVNAVAGSAQAGAVQAPDRSLEDMGTAADTITGMGTSWFSYTFTVPPGQVATGDPYLNLAYSNSALVDSARSGAVVFLNGDAVGSVELSNTNANTATAKINLPFSSIHPGLNTIDIEATLLPHKICSAFSFNGLWMTIYPETLLHLPLTAAAPQAIALQDLSTYPYPFANDPSLSTTTFVVPSADHNAWANAGRVAYDMGARSTGAVLALSAAYDGQLSDAQKKGDLILVGQPKDLSVVNSLKTSMPAYFDKGSNIANLLSQQVSYRIAPAKDLGYLELFESPWQSQRAVLTVLGTSANGLANSTAAIVTSRSRQNLRGNFATVDGDQTTVVDTRTGAGTGQLPSALGQGVTAQVTPVVVSTVAPQVTTATYNKQPILMVLVLVGVLIVGVLVSAIAIQRRKPKSTL